MKKDKDFFDISVEGHDNFSNFAETLPEALKEFMLALGDDLSFDDVKQINTICEQFGYVIDYDLSASIVSMYYIN